MIKKYLGNTGYKIAPVVYGGIVSGKDGQEASDRYVSWAIDREINYFDVAPTYGDAQEKLGNSLIPYRKKIHLACKTMQRLRKEAERELKESFRLLHTDYFDVYQMHALSSMEDVELAFGPGGIMELLVEAKKEGYIRRIGISAHSEEAALKALSLYDFDTVLFPFNWGLHMAKGIGSDLAKTAKDKGIGLLALKSLIHRAWLNDEEKDRSVFPKSWCKPIDTDNTAFGVAAMKYTLSMGVDALVPPGNFDSFSFAVENIEECIAHPLSDEDIKLLKAELPNVENHMFF